MYMVNKGKRGKINCNLRRRTIPFIALFMLSALSWLNDTNAYIFCKMSFLNYVAKNLRKYPSRNLSVKLQVADGLLGVVLHLRFFSKAIPANSNPFF